MAELGYIQQNWDVMVTTNLLTSIDTRQGILDEKLWAMVREAFTSINELHPPFQWSCQTFYFIFLKIVAQYGWFTLSWFFNLTWLFKVASTSKHSLKLYMHGLFQDSTFFKKDLFWGTSLNGCFRQISHGLHLC